MFRLGRRSLLGAGGLKKSQSRKCPPISCSTSTFSTSAGNSQRDLPSEADVVVIGGGSLGCNTLYHLAKLGVTNTVLLEKNKLTAGTTWHTAGLVWRLRPNDVDVQLLNHTRDMVKSLEEETGINPGWEEHGGLFIAHTKERLDEYKRLQTLGKAFGIHSKVLSPSETKEIYPLMNSDNFYAALNCDTDGHVDPHGLCTGLAKSATRAGAKIFEECKVKDIVTAEGTFGTRTVQAVQTSEGEIKTKCVINCSGAWSNNITKMVGVTIPLVPMKHAYVVTERIEGIAGMPNVRDHDASVYLKTQGDALQVGGYEIDPIILDDGVEADFAFGLYELDWDVFSAHIQGAVNLVPCLEQTGIKSTVCGPESFTPDHKPIMGEDPRVRGFYHGCGFNSSGMMLGGGCGHQLSQWVVHGRPELDMYGYDIRRFCPEVSRSPRWTRERSHEAYAKNYSIVFPHDEPLAGRNMKKDPLHDELVQAGCVFQERLGWERPGWFSREGPAPLLDYDYYGAYPEQQAAHKDYTYNSRLREDYTFGYPGFHETLRHECLSARQQAALFNMSYFGKFYLGGPQAQAAADWIFSNRLDVPAGSVVYTCMLNKRAGIESDLTVSVLEEQEERDGELNRCQKGRGFYIAAAGGSANQCLVHLQQTIQDAGFTDVHLEDRSRDLGVMSLQGPKSRDILSELTGTDLSNESFPLFSQKVISVAGHKVRALRVSFVGELGWELHVPRESCVPVYRALHEKGAPLGMVNAAYRAMDSLSMEKGYPHWHQEIRIDDNPLEAGLMFTCKLKTDTDFLGRKALEEVKKQGAKKKKVCLTLENKDLCLLGLETIYRDGHPVGFLRRAEYAFHLDCPIGYGYVNPSNTSDRSSLANKSLQASQYELEIMGQRHPAKLHIKSPFDPKSHRMQGDYESKTE